ncbi:hypothetical protein SAMN05660649_04466 [Desulfotomaculum arcticum]|uniref:Ig-like domain (Group 3) n=1 Tax=Desulfotruncus arcticus DSM 17038 TaxID=1121424 RepID=A0A1I2YJK0_9FIRM|nr:hypothetical protein [Desulfotruncus arcticus]SFH25798.1 hypothetical protein SAMN05660649_04466 [Desulfotomaculum arcticum] [Desulfotruncus arcticus DSM 17038]
MPIDTKIYDAVRDKDGTVLQTARDIKTTVNNGYNNNGKSLSATYDKANAAADATYIRNQQLPDLSNKIANLEANITNINNTIASDTTPPAVDWATVSGATATGGSSISIVITATDNVSSSLQYSINGSTYAALPAKGKVSAPVTSSGPNAITVSVKDEAGNVGSKTKTVWKLN